MPAADGNDVVVRDRHAGLARPSSSVSAAFNEAMAEKAYRDRRQRSLWKAKSEQADPDRVARMMAHIDQQLTQ